MCVLWDVLIKEGVRTHKDHLAEYIKYLVNVLPGVSSEVLCSRMGNYCCLMCRIAISFSICALLAEIPVHNVRVRISSKYRT